MNEAQVFVAGYVAREPKFRKTHNGYSYTSLRVGYTPRRMDRDSGEWSDGGTSFVTVFCWRGLADNVATCVRKGDPVLIKGKLQVRPFTDKDGAARVAVEVEASSIGHDLARGVANFQRAHRTAGETALERANTGRPGEPAADVATDGIPAAPPAGMFAEDAVAALAGAAADDPDDDAEQAAADAAEPGAGPAVPESDAEAVGVATPF
jgi:single-strand DNA-binding protein